MFLRKQKYRLLVRDIVAVLISITTYTHVNVKLKVNKTRKVKISLPNPRMIQNKDSKSQPKIVTISEHRFLRSVAAVHSSTDSDCGILFRNSFWGIP